MNRWIILLCSLVLVLPAQSYAGKRTEGAVLGFIGGYLVGKHVEKNKKRPPGRAVRYARSPMEQAFKSQTRYVRKQVQGKLKERGFYHSYIDGYWGRGTRSALESFAAESENTHLLTTNHGANELMSMLLRPEDAEQLTGAPETPTVAATSSADGKGQDDMLDTTSDKSSEAKDLDDKKRMLKIAGEQLALLNMVLRFNEKSGDQSTFSREKARAIKDRIAAIDSFRSQASLGTTIPVVGMNMPEASKIVPILPYTLPQSNEIGEMRVEPRQSDNGLLIYDLDFRQPGAGYANTRDTFSVYSVGMEDFMMGLEKAHKWSDIAKSKNIRQKHSKVAACFPATLCKDSQAAGSATEVVFMIGPDGTTAARIQRNDGNPGAGYNLSIDTALILSAYLDYMKGEGEASYTGGTMTKTDLDTLFK